VGDPSSSGFASGSDELGAFVRVNVDPTVFSETAILKTAYWFTESYYVFIARDRGTGLLRVEFRSKSAGSAEQLKAACGDFWNQLVDFEVRQKVFAETSSVRDALIKKAFFEAKARPADAPTSNGHIVGAASKRTA
jgi:His-Xaa-Ser system protein HxsD